MLQMVRAGIESRITVLQMDRAGIETRDYRVTNGQGGN